MKEKETKCKVLDAPKTETEQAEQVQTEVANITRRGKVCYKSTLLNKVFDNYDELVKAEEEYEKVNAEKIKEAEIKKARAKEVEDAYKEAMQIRKEYNAKIAEADKKYYELRDAFIKDYKSFHMSYSDETGDVIVKSLFDIFNW